MPGRAFHLWPDLDQRLWERAHQQGRSLLEVGGATAWRPATSDSVAKGWGVFLAFLDGIGELDPTVRPPARITPDRYRRFIEAQQAVGNRNTSIVERCYELRMALNVMETAQSDALQWLVMPGGRPIGAWVPGRPVRKPVPDATVLAQWARDLIAESGVAADTLRQAHCLRDGLIIGLLAERAPRIASLSGMTLDTHLLRHNAGFRVGFRGEDMKAGKPLDYDLPADLCPAMDAYLRTGRLAFGATQAVSAVWVKEGGQAFGKAGIETMIRRRSEARFGKPFGPHAFRHALATTAINLLPEQPGLAAAILGNSHRVVERSYARADTVIAARAFQEMLAEQRAALRDVAEDLFARY